MVRVIKYNSWAIMVLMRISTYLVICYVAQVLREVLMVKWLRILMKIRVVVNPPTSYRFTKETSPN